MNWYSNAVAAFWQGSGGSLWWSAACAGCAAHPPPVFKPQPRNRLTAAAATHRGRGGDDPRVTTLPELARAGDAIAKTSSKSEKVRLLAQFLADD